MAPLEFTSAGGPAAHPPADRDRRLELIDLRRNYGTTVALDGLSFTVGAGRMMGFVGPNGAGKTTAMRIVLGVLETTGSMLFRSVTSSACSLRPLSYTNPRSWCSTNPSRVSTR